MEILYSLTSFDALASLFTLAILEIVLGIDNLIFLSLLTNRLPDEQQRIARKIGLIFAMLSRLALLAAMNWVTQLEGELFSLFEIPVSIRSLVLGIGGVFLVYKAVGEIHSDIEGDMAADSAAINHKTLFFGFWWVITQVMILDIVFSLDSVITAVGMTHNYTIMAIAIVLAVLTMLFAAEPLSEFINKHPTVKMLALSFLILVGVMLMGESIGHHIEKGYLYFAIAFSMSVECLNIIAAKKKKDNH